MGYKKLAQEINECFGEPFLPEGFVKAKVFKGILFLSIGDRDGEFDNDGIRVGSGSNVGEAIRWHLRQDRGCPLKRR